MSVYKEGFEALQQIISNSKQIWGDSADFGVLAKKNDKFWNFAKLLGTYYSDITSRKVNVYQTQSGYMKSQSIIIMLMDEWAISDKRLTVEQATQYYNLNVCQISKSPYDVIISIDAINKPLNYFND